MEPFFDTQSAIDELAESDIEPNRAKAIVASQTKLFIIHALSKQDLSDLSVQLGSMNARITRLEERFSWLEERLTRLEERFTRLEERFTRLEARFTLFEGKFTRLEAQVTQLENELKHGFARSEERLDAAMNKLLIRVTIMMTALIGAATSVVAVLA